MAELLKNIPVKERKNFPVEEDTPPMKILFIGDERVGKTTFITRYCDYMRDYYGCDLYRSTFLALNQHLLYTERFGRRLPVRFLDLPAGTTAESRRDQYPTLINLIVVCFAIDDPTSLRNVSRIWLPESRQYCPQFRFFLLGLKSDMTPGIGSAATQIAREVHRRYGFSGDYLECSVEGNPEYARHCMDVILTDAFMHNTPRVSN